jgi:hypothetical protein
MREDDEFRQSTFSDESAAQSCRWMAAILDGRVQGSETVFEAKFMMPWSFSEEAAVVKYMPQLQYNMW